MLATAVLPPIADIALALDPLAVAIERGDQVGVRAPAPVAQCEIDSSPDQAQDQHAGSGRYQVPQPPMQHFGVKRR